MASIGTLFPTTTSSATSGLSSTNSSQSSTSATSSADPTDGLGNEQTFLQLLVAQLQNQDPTQPADGMQFVTQLAEFSNVEQSLQMRTDLDSIEQKYVGGNTTATSSTDGTSSTGASSAVTDPAVSASSVANSVDPTSFLS